MIKRKRLLWQLYPSYLVLVLLAVLATGWFASHAMRTFFVRQTRQDLKNQAYLLAAPLEQLLSGGDTAAVDTLCKTRGSSVPTRLTVILPNGVVAGDSETDPRQMENHGDRPEFRSALAGKPGSAMRFSGTLRQRMLYEAIAIRKAETILGVMRVSIATSAIDEQLGVLQVRVAGGGVVIAVLASVVCLIISRRISRPIEAMRKSADRFARGDLAHRIIPPSTHELAGLAAAMNRMAKELSARMLDITRQRNESQTVLSSMVEGVVALGPDEHILHTNQAAAGLLGLPADQMIGRSIQEIVRNRDLHNMVTTTLAEGNNAEGDIVVYMQGEQILNTHCTPLLDTDGERIGVLLVLHDVTTLRRLENMRRDFAANVSHEIKTPLTAIQGFVETLYHGAVENPEEAKRFLGIIHKHVNRLTAIIDDLLKLSRLEQDEESVRLQMKAVSLKSVLDTAVQLCAVAAGKKRIRLDVDCEEVLTAFVDVEMMEQVCVNLLDNAIKYSPEDSRIQVNVYKKEDAICIDFRDQGIGIPRKHLPRLFERFYRVDKARSRKMGGTGLGLAIVKHIVAAHGGSIDVQSVQGAGSTFTIQLPAEPLDKEAENDNSAIPA